MRFLFWLSVGITFSLLGTTACNLRPQSVSQTGLPSPSFVPSGAQTAPPGPAAADAAPSIPPGTNNGSVAPTQFIGTLNLEWFSLAGRKPRTEADLKRVAEVIQQTEAALLGLEEINDDGVMNSLLRYLPGWKYYLGTSGRQQRCAILWDTTRAAVRRPVEWADINKDLEASSGNLRAPLVAEAKVGKFDFTFIVVHLKAMGDEESVRKRRTQLRRLRSRLEEYLSNRKDKDVIIVGDFNDTADSPAMKELIGSRKGGLGFVVTGAKLPKTAVTYMNPAGRIDHVVISSPYISQEEWNSNAATFPKPKGQERKAYEESVSDHLPTWSGFDTAMDRD